MGLTETEKYTYTQRALWAQLLHISGLEIEYDDEGEHWLISDKNIGANYGTGDTPQKALEAYIEGVETCTLIEQDYIREQLGEE